MSEHKEYETEKTKRKKHVDIKANLEGTMKKSCSQK